MQNVLVARRIRRWIHMGLLMLMLVQTVLPAGAQERSVEPITPDIETTTPEPEKTIETAPSASIELSDTYVQAALPLQRGGIIRQLEPCLTIPRIYLPHLTKHTSGRIAGEPTETSVCLLDMNTDTAMRFDLQYITAPEPIISPTIHLNPGHGSISLSESTLYYTPTSAYSGSDSLEIAYGNNGIIRINLTIEPGTAIPIVPVISCVETSDTTVTARLSAYNYSTSVVSAPIGLTNQFLAEPIDQGQPTSFEPGLSASTFDVNFDSAAELEWVLGKRRLTVDSSMFPCTPANTAPTVNPITINVSANSSADVELSFYAQDAENDPLTWAMAEGPTNGTATLIESTLWYTPTQNYTGTDGLIYSVDDGEYVVTGTVDILVTNAAPLVSLQASPISGTVPLTVNFTTTASDPDGNDAALTYAWYFGDGTTSSDLISTTHVYTQDGLYAPYVVVTDETGAQSSAMVQIRAGNVVNSAPLASNERLYLTEGMTTGIDLALISSDIDGDVLSWSVDTNAQYGEVSITGSQLVYTRTAAYTGTDSFTYAVADATETTTATLTIIDNRILIRITPSSVIIPGNNLTHTLEAKGYDYQGNEVPLTGIDLEWLVSHANWITGTSSLTFTTVPGNPNQIIVQSTAEAGAATFVAQSTSDVQVRSNIVTVKVAEPEANSILVQDSQIIFPPANIVSTEQITAAYPFINGDYQIGSFTLEEVLSEYNILTVTTDLREERLEEVYFAIVVEGVVPTQGQILIATESAQLFGRVLRTTVRGSYSLVTLQLIGYPEAFQTIDFYLNTDRLIEDGVHIPETVQLIAIKNEQGQLDLYERTPEALETLVQPYTPRNESYTTQTTTGTGATENNPWFNIANWGPPDGYEQKVGECITEAEINWGDLSLKPSFQFDPRLKTGLKTQTIVTEYGVTEYVENAHLSLTISPTLGLEAELRFQANGEISINCLLKKYNIRLPLASTAHPFILALREFLNPEVKLNINFGVEASFEGGPKLLLKWGASTNIWVIAGFDYANNELTYVPPSDLQLIPENKITRPEVILQGDIGFDRWKGEIGIGLYATGTFQFRLLGSVFDVLNTFSRMTAAERLLRAFEYYLTIDMLELKLGVEIKTAWATPAYVLWDHVENHGGEFEPEHAAQVPFSVSLKAGKLDKLLEIFGLDNIFEGEIQLGPKDPIFEWKWFEALSPGAAWLEHQGRPTDVVWHGDTLKVVAEPEENEAWPYFKGEIYYIDDPAYAGFITLPEGELKREGDQLVGTFEVPERACKDKPQGTAIQFHLLGYNEMTLGNIPTASYIGAIDAICSTARVDIILPQIIENAPDRVEDPYRPDDPELTEVEWPTMIPQVYACNDPDNPYDQRDFTAEAHAYDESGNLEKLDFLFGGNITKQGGPGIKRLSASLTHDFGSENLEYHPVYATAYVRREGGELVETTIHRPFFMIYRSCNTKDFDRRVLETTCQRIFQERFRIGEIVTPPGGVPMIVFPAWDDRKHPWYTTGSAPKNFVCAWFVGGDPHITTMDGLRFDSFSLGEFIYLAPRTGYEGPTVHVRQERVGPVAVGDETLFTAEWTSWNTAIAFEMDETIFEFRTGQFLTPLINREPTTLTPGLYSFGEVDLAVNSAREVELRFGSNRFRIMDRFGAWLDIESFVLQDDSLAGMAGRPNATIEDDFQWPDGREALDAYDFANGWRIQDAESSLFTYPEGEGPWTYNLRQDDEPPSQQELAPYLEQAENLLSGTCEPATIDEIDIRNVALELYVGRNPAEIARTGVCFYRIFGTVTNELVPDLPVPGAKITVSDSDGVLCEAWSDRYGNYTCLAPSTGSLDPFQVETSNRGLSSTTLTRTTLPDAGGLLGLEQNLQVVPTTIQITGTVQDQTNQTLYNAEVRVTGPSNAGYTSSYTRTNATGVYTTYMMLDDGVTAGEINYKLLFSPDFDTSPNAQTVVSEQSRPFSGLIEHELNTLQEDFQFTGVLLRLSGRVTFAFDDRVAVEGVRILIEPTVPHPEFERCDITSLVYISPLAVANGYELDPRKETTDRNRAGTYLCEVPLESLAPFDITIKALNRETGSVVATETGTIDPGVRGAGEPFNVVTPVYINTPVLYLEGTVTNPQGTPVAGATISAETAGGILIGLGQSDVTGAYSTYLPLDETTTNGTIEYELEYRNISTRASQAFSGAFLGTPITVTQNLVAQGSYAEYFGRVIDIRTNQPVYDATVEITSPDDPQVNCRTFTGDYRSLTPDEYLIPPSILDQPFVPKRCKQMINSHAPQQIRLVYNVTRPGSSEVFTYTYQPPALGGYGFIGRDLLTRSITPTILGLNGTITRPSGVPLAGALVTAEVDGVTISTRTDENGQYAADLILPVNVLTGTINYSVRYRSLSVTDTLSFTANQYTTTNVAHDITYTPRTIFFRGIIQNSYGISLPATTIQISSTDLVVAGETDCTTQADMNGVYLCAAQTQATSDIEVSYSLNGIWGSTTITETLFIDPNLDIINVDRDLTAELTVIHSTGRVTTPAGEGLEGVEITASGADVLRIERYATDADGYYDFYVVLRPRTSQTWTGSLQYTIGYGTEGRLFFVDYAATKNQEMAVERDFVLDMRVVSFEGKLLNSHIPITYSNQFGVLGTAVVVDSPQLGPLCRFESLERYREAKYTCQARVFTSQPFEYVYTLTGEWGSASYTGTLTSIPEPGSIQRVERNFTLTPTTLLLQGTVTDLNGAPLRNVEVELDSPSFITQMEDDQLTQSYKVKTDSQGKYSQYVVVNQATTQTEISYDVVYSFSGETYTLADAKNFTVQRGALRTVITNFRFPYRKVTFKGSLINGTDPSVDVEGKLQIVSPTFDRTLCSDIEVSTTQDYQCDVLLESNQDYLVSYRVVGVWGTANLFNQSITGTLTTVPMDIQVEPRVVRFQGTVRTTDGIPLEAATVKVRSYNIINEQEVKLEDETSATGSYEIGSVLGDGVSKINVQYEVNVQGNILTVDQAYTFDPQALDVSLEQDFSINTSQLHFHGILWNSLLNDTGPWSSNNQVVVESPTLGQLCTAKLSRTFDCTATIPTQEPFDVTYTIFADWGTTEITERITVIPSLGTEGFYTTTLAVTPTMLRLTGTAMVTDGVQLKPLSNAEIRTGILGEVSSPLVSSIWSTSNTTSGDGTFDLLVMLKEVQDTTSGTLSLIFDQTFVDQYVFEATEQVLNTADIGTRIFENYPDGSERNRTVILQGTFINSLVPNVPAAQPRAFYALQSPTLGTICTYDKPGEPPPGGYHCPFSVQTDEPFEVIVYTWGPYGGAEPRQYQVTTIPEVGQTTVVQEDIGFTVTTARMSGMVYEPATMPISLAGVNVETELIALDKPQNGSYIRAEQQTSANGIFDIYMLFPASLQTIKYADLVYNLDLDGIESKLALTNQQIKQGALNEWTYLIPFEKRRVRFAGRVTNSFVPSLGVPGQVFITAPDYSTVYCDADINPETGFYSCDATFQSSQPISVNYRINGMWGTKDITATISSLAGVGSTTFVERDMQVSPTTVRLFGMVTDSYGKPLGNTQIQINDSIGNVFAGQLGGAQTVGTVTDVTGAYETYALIRPNVTQGDLQYNLTYYNSTEVYSSSLVGLVQNTLNEQRLDFEIDSRNVVFNGRVHNVFAPNVGMLGSLMIRSGNTSLCATELDDGSEQENPALYIGEYLCTVRGVSMESLAVDYMVQGDWGEQSGITDTVPFGQVGGQQSFLKNIAVQPTTLRLVGRLTDGLNTPLPEADIRIQSAALSAVQSAVKTTTDAQGLYTATVTLKQDMLTGTLNYQVSLNGGSASLAVPFAATVDELTVLSQDISFETREVVFKGTIRNTHTANAPVMGVQVAVQDTSGTVLCQDSSDLNGRYECSTYILDNSTVAVRYVLSGDWGTAVYTDTIPASPSNVTTELDRSWSIQPTMLSLSGVVRDTNGAPIPNAEIEISGAGVSTLSGFITIQTDGFGRYASLVVLREGLYVDALTYQVSANSNQATIAVPYTAAPNQVTALQKDVLFTVRTINFNGTVVNSHVPTFLMRSTNVAIRTADGSNLCFPTTNASGAYSCAVQVVNDASFAIEYVVSGDWGTTIIPGTVPSGVSGTTGNVTRILQARPTTLALRGIIRDAQGAALPNTLVAVDTAALSGVYSSVQTQTNAQGVYSTTLILKANAVTGTLRYDLVVGSEQGAVFAAFTAAPSNIVTVNRDVTFAPRELHFSGMVVNTFAPAMAIPDTMVDIRSSAGSMCTTVSQADGSYTCVLQSAENQAYPLDYVLDGAWGSSLVTGMLPTSAESETIYTVPNDLFAQVTTLQLQGQILDGSTGVEGVAVTVASSDAVATLPAVSNGTGAYTVYLGLEADVAQTSLNYSVQAGYMSESRTIGLNNIAQADLTVFDQDFYFTQREINVDIDVRSSYGYGIPVLVDQVTISTANTGPLCILDDLGSSQVGCTSLLITNQPFMVTYELTGTWGTHTYNDMVYPGSSTSPINVSEVIAVTPRTIKLFGSITDPFGYPVNDGVITATSPFFDQSFVTNGDTYELYPYIADQSVSGTLSLTLTVDVLGDLESRVVTWDAASTEMYKELPAQDFVLGPDPQSLVITPSSLTATVTAGEVITRTIVGSNGGEQDLNLFYSQVYEGNEWLDGPYIYYDVITPSQQVSWTLTMDATALVSGTYTGVIGFATDDPAFNDDMYYTVTLQVIGVPSMVVSPTELFYGDTIIGSTVSRTIALMNNGTTDITLDAVAISDSAFSVDWISGTLAPNETRLVEVGFTPLAVENYIATATLTTSHMVYDIPLSGAGILPPALEFAPASVSSSTLAGSIITPTFTITNAGASPLNWSFQYLPDHASTPDAFGYRWIDNSQPGGPAFRWNDISTTGTPVTGLFDDDYVGPLDIGFDFEFYGQTYQQFYIASNGYIGFGSGYRFNSRSQQELPDTSDPDNLIAWSWADLRNRGSVYYQLTHEGLIVQFQDYGLDSSSTPRADVQIVLGYNHSIQIRYNQVDAGWDIHTVGIENEDGTVGLTAAHEASYAQSGRVIEFFTEPSWLRFSPAQGSLAPGATLTLDLILDATELLSSTYALTPVLLTNDPNNPRTSIPVSLEVLGTPELAFEPAPFEIGPIFTNQSFTQTLLVRNVGSDHLELTSLQVVDPVWSLGLTTTQLFVGQAVSIPVSLASSTAGQWDSELLFTSARGLTWTTVLSGTVLDPPTLVVAPSSFEVALSSGQRLTQTLTISNTGLSELRWNTASFTESALSRSLADLNRDYASITALIPQRYNFIDGVTGTSIADGGANMYDTGNRLNTNLDSSLPYSDNVITATSAFGPDTSYFTRKFPGLFVMGATLNGPEFFLVSGNLGTAGFGFFETSILTTTVDGVEYMGFVKRVYGNSTPSVNHIIIVPATSGLTQITDNSTSSDWHQLTGLQNTSRMFYLMYAGTDGFYIDDDHTLAIMRQFLKVAGRSQWLTGGPSSGTIAAGASTTVDVVFAPEQLSAGVYTQSINLQSNDPATPVRAVPLTLTVAGMPSLSVPSTFESGQAFVGATVTRTLTVSNTGTAALTLTDILSSQPVWSVPFTTTVLEPGAAVQIPVRFMPAAVGPVSGTLTVQSSAGSATVEASGIGVAPPIIDVPASINLSIAAGSQLTYSLAISNTGANELVYSMGVQTPRNGVLDVAILGADSSLDLQDVATKLQATNLFNSVTVINVSQRTPSLTELQNYQAVLVFSGNSFSDSTALGNVVADYIDQGGGVLLMQYALRSGLAYSLQGRFDTGNYYAIDPDWYRTTRTAVGTIHAPGHPIFEQVDSFDPGSGGGFRSIGGLAPGAVSLAEYRDGTILAAEKFISTTAGLRPRIDLNFIPVSSDRGSNLWNVTTDGALLMANALLHVGQPTWLQGAMVSGTVASSDAAVVNLVFDAAALPAGSYQATLVIISNDVVNPRKLVPVTLTVN